MHSNLLSTTSPTLPYAPLTRPYAPLRSLTPPIGSPYAPLRPPTRPYAPLRASLYCLRQATLPRCMPRKRNCNLGRAPAVCARSPWKYCCYGQWWCNECPKVVSGVQNELWEQIRGKRSSKTGTQTIPSCEQMIAFNIGCFWKCQNPTHLSTPSPAHSPHTHPFFL